MKKDKNKKEIKVLDNDKKELNIFPLSPTHRKELKELKNNNIQDLRDRFYIIKKLKSQEFYDKNKNKIEKLVAKNLIICNNLNFYYEEMLGDIFNIIRGYKQNEQKNINPFIRRQNVYESNFLGGFVDDKDKFIYKYFDRSDKENPLYYVQEHEIKKEIEKEFKKKFNDKFDKFINYINELEEKFKESVVFGDLLTCKNIYYELKECDKMLDELDKLKV